MEKYLDITKPRFSERILPVPWPLVISRFYCTTMTLENIKFNILKLGGNSIVNRVKCKLSSRNFSSNFFCPGLLISYPESGIVSRVETTLSYETHTDVTTQRRFNLHAPEAFKRGACVHIKTCTLKSSSLLLPVTIVPGQSLWQVQTIFRKKA